MDGFLASVEKRAFKIAVFATRNTDDALDIVQEAMLKLTAKYAARPASQWPALFHRVLQSKIMDWHRRTKVRNRWRVWFADDNTESGVNIEDLAGDQSVSAERAAGNEHLLGDLELAIASLPIRQQQAFVLRTLEGLSVAETARAMRCSDGSVKTHLSRALHTLRGELEAHYQ